VSGPATWFCIIFISRPYRTGWEEGDVGIVVASFHRILQLHTLHCP
jgi:hypothetical protein